jgi:hypothetical protein
MRYAIAWSPEARQLLGATIAWGTAGWLGVAVRAPQAGHNFTHFRLVLAIVEISTVAGPN